MLKYRKEFHDMFTEFSEHSEFGPLMTRMQVVDAQGDSKMDEEQWEAASKSCLVYQTPLADIPFRHLHWVHLRETVAVSLLSFCVLLTSLCFSVLAVSCILVYPRHPSHYWTPAPLVGRVPIFCNGVYVALSRHFIQVV